MTLEEALACVDRGIAKATALGLKLSFAVLDEYGQLVRLDRMDGAALVSPDIAEAKAVTSVNFKLSTHEIAQMDPAALQAISEVVHFKLLALAGGIPIYDGTKLKGAIRVSGAAPEQEDEVARHAIGA